MLMTNDQSDNLFISSIRKINSSGSVLSIEFNQNWTEEKEISWLNHNVSVEQFQPVLELNQRGPSPSACNPNDPYYFFQWNMQKMKFDEAWCYNNSGLSPRNDTLVVGVIEYGFNFEYKDIIPNIFTNNLEIPDNGIDDDMNFYTDDYYGYNSQSGGDDHPSEDHGTQVLSVIGAKGNNKIDLSGTNQNIKMLVCSGANNTDNLLSCYYYLLEMKRSYLNSGGKRGAFIVSSNLSSGLDRYFPDQLPLICAVYDSLGEVGILTAVATVNFDENIDTFGDIPGLCPSKYIVVTTNTDRNDRRVSAGYSQTNVDIAAGGENVYMIDAQGMINTASGTSFASPHVAGAISLLYQYCPELTDLNKHNPLKADSLVKQFILGCGDDIAELNGITTSGKRLNMIKALECLNKYCSHDTTKIPFRFILKNNLLNEPLEIIFNPESFGTYNLYIYNNLGQLVDRKTLIYAPGSLNRQQIDIYGWSSGIYHLFIEGNNFESFETIIKL